MHINGSRKVISIVCIVDWQHTTYTNSHTHTNEHAFTRILSCQSVKIIHSLCEYRRDYQTVNSSKWEWKTEKEVCCMFVLTRWNYAYMHRSTLLADTTSAMSYCIRCVDYCIAIRMAKLKRYIHGGKNDVVAINNHGS